MPTGGGGGGGCSGASSAGALRLPATISDRYAREAREGEAGVRLRKLLGLTERTAGRPTAERLQREAMLGPLREAYMATEDTFDYWWPGGAEPVRGRANGVQTERAA